MASLVLVFVPVLHAGEVETLRKRCAEQERQIRELETEVTRLRSELQQRAHEGVIPVSTGEVLDIRRAEENAGKKSAAASKNLYTVKKGDTLTSIARHFGTTVEAIVKQNSISNPSRLRIGDKLEIPAKRAAAVPPSTTPKPSPTPAPATAKGKTYKVKRGDTLYRIAKLHRTSIAALEKANPGLNPKNLRVGQVIRLAETAPAPRTTEVGPPAPPKTASLPAAAPKPAPSRTPAPASEKPAATDQPALHLVRLSRQMTFEEFARKHGATVEQLNEWNGQNLAGATLLDKDSELYVPKEP